MLKIAIYVCVAYVVSAASKHDLTAFKTAEDDLTNTVNKYIGKINTAMETYNTSSEPALTIKQLLNVKRELITTYEESMKEALDYLKRHVSKNSTCVLELEPIHPQLRESIKEIFRCMGVNSKDGPVKAEALEKKETIDHIKKDTCYPALPRNDAQNIDILTCLINKKTDVVILGNKALFNMEIEYQRIQKTEPYTCDIENEKVIIYDVATKPLKKFFGCVVNYVRRHQH